MPVVMKGDRQIVRNLNMIEARITQRGMLAAVVSGALIVSNAAKQKAPVVTGTLRRSIHVGGAGDRSGDFRPRADITEYSELDQPDRTGHRVTAFVGTNLEYAPTVELGTGQRPAKPYLRPALDENHNAVLIEMAEALREVIRRTRT